MADCQELYNQLLSDSEAMFDGMPNDMKKAAVADEYATTHPFLLAYDTEMVNEAIRDYAAGRDIPSLTLKERWCLAVRMKTAADILCPFRKPTEHTNNAFRHFFEAMGKDDLLLALLLDAAPVLSSILSGQITFGSEWVAPMRLPWHQSLLRKE